ncbi:MULTISPECIES: ribonuclease E/G [Acetobacter]|uniref:Ribonuclease E n=7 Tax=Acetobacter TaxID=434 RepID=A0A841QCC6_9PROT|nr:ribonuclease E/G [Acetobacter lovaniensis]MBB6456231.1 ribonuclease E [Acetobacter lovaniensis]MCI1697934.1 Rne/Rng family ribonuclease [Acetobacter lovaniensis]MCI1796004.1 Rne/Rng family ribonuclease [Acetobacter lovaniensis]MCP1239063.1 Rne/Rng family ribonuclease [Acetobacter lovaniensis]GBQ73192.1 ribonuclease E [Acetobacter lovaniensis NRIC 0474]
MSKRMLIDATHAEETRVVVMDGNRLEDYDVESASKKQLKGNIYLARVIRVEPSLQAAFVEYGGNRHGFLAFSEIHPDYYQIPVADREKLLALQAEEETLLDDSDEDEATAHNADAEADETSSTADHDGAEGDEDRQETPEYVSGETDTGEEALIQKRIARFLRNYRIQEVIRRRQVLLVQVVKEERGNKGAALTTYVSLAGRYCVLMPNALRGGGVSRKITSVADRRRLRDIVSSLNLPRGMAMIVRTAGAQRPGPEITRDCEYLLHLWDDIREHTLQSMAPALIYEEASLVKRAIRDVYTRDVSEIVVDGESGWKAARDFMRMLMPQHAEKVRLWSKEHQPLFTHYNVEGHLDAMFSPVVALRSGGYLVINQTEALVAIDVNSGKATSQRNIEETAFRTNQEAADEVARQLRLRDLAGLIVIDFIDMESRRHNATIERRLKDALRHDRARIQIGSISHFGLLEMSRQRLRPSVAEAAFTVCPHCNGTGMTRSVESSALHVLRSVEEEGARRRAGAITVHVAAEIAFYILNNKRDWLANIEQRHQMDVLFSPDNTLPAPEIRIERRSPPRPMAAVQQQALPPVENVDVDVDADIPTPAPAALPSSATPDTAETASGDEEPRRRRRRRRRRGGNGNANAQGQNGAPASTQADAEDTDEPAAAESTPAPQQGTDGQHLVPGRRRTRHSRVQRQAPESGSEQRVAIEEGPAPRPQRAVWTGPTPANPFGDGPDIFELLENSAQARPAPAAREPSRKDMVAEAAPAPQADAQVDEQEAPRKPGRRRPTRKPAVARANAPGADTADAPAEPKAPTSAVDAGEATEAAPQKPARRRAPRGRTAAAGTEAETVQDTPAAQGAEEEAPKKPTRRRTTRKTSAEAAPQADATTAPATEEKAEPLVQPIVIEDSPPATRRRTGWWKR